MTINFENVLFLSGSNAATVKRTPAATSGDVFNIFSYGGANPPDPTGVADSTAAIQAAITAAANSSNGGRVYIPAGQYKIMQPLDLSTGAANLTISGDGDASLLNATCLGFVLCWAGQLNNGGINVRITGASSGTGGAIRLTIVGDSQSFPAGTVVRPSKMVAQNMPYVINGIVGSGNVFNLNGTTRRFTIVDDTHIEIPGTTFTTGYVSGGFLAGGADPNKALRIEDLKVRNGQFDSLGNSGAIYIGYSSYQSSVVNCTLEAHVGADLASNPDIGGSFGVGIYNCEMFCTAPLGPADQSGPAYAGGAPGSVGLFLGEGIASNCRAQGFNIGFCMGGVCPNLIGCSVEVCNIGTYVGQRNNSTTDIVQCGTIIGMQIEQCPIGNIIYSASGLMISGCHVICTAGGAIPSNLAASNSLVWNGSTLVTVTTANPHNLGSIGTKQSINLQNVPAGYTAQSNANNVLATVTSTTQFTYPLTSNPGANFSGGNWTYGSSFFIQVVAALASSVFSANDTTQMHPPGGAINSMDLSSGNHRNNTVMSMDLASGFSRPAPINKAAWQFIGPSNFGANLSMSFNDLPGQTPGSNQGSTALEGMQYYIVDANTATIGNSVTAAGAPNTHGFVIFNGTAWTLMSK